MNQTITMNRLFDFPYPQSMPSYFTKSHYNFLLENTCTRLSIAG